MSIQNLFYLVVYLFFIVILALCIPCVAKSANKDKIPLKLVVKTEEKQDKDVKNVMKKLANLATNMEKTAKLYRTISQTAYWESEAKVSFLKLIESQGYYDGSIETEILDDENTIIFYVSGWERYKIKKIQIIKALNSNNDIKIPNVEKLKIKEGDFAIAEDILSAQSNLKKLIEKENCLLTLSVKHEAIIDNSDDTMIVKFIINAGPDARIKSVDIDGLTEVNPEYVRKLIKIKNGQCFRESLINDVEKDLRQSGLFNSTKTDIPKKTDQNGKVPVVFNLTESKHRSLKAGLSYASDLGLGGILGWDHRNFLGNGERLESNFFGNKVDRVLNVTMTKPFYKRDDQTLKLNASVKNVISKAFNSKEGEFSAGLKRQLNKIWSVGVASKYSYAEVRKARNIGNFAYFSVPIFIKRDTRDNILNARRGNEIGLITEPFIPAKKNDKYFLKNKFYANTYFSFNAVQNPVLALAASIGSINGISDDNIPTHERFYLGGSGSVRGYEYQLAGDLDSNNRPLGGKSFLQSSFEIRMKVSENFGIVTFLDAGNIFNSTAPVFKKKMFYGTGIGVRYFTDFGPLRLDIGFPLHKRSKIDKSFQIYFGIGQEF